MVSYRESFCWSHGAVPVGNWWEKRIRLRVLGQVQGVVARSVPHLMVPISTGVSVSKSTSKEVLLDAYAYYNVWGFFPSPSSLECNLVLEKLPLLCTISSCWLLFACLCHWADQSLVGFTGSITWEFVWKCRLITGAHLSGKRQAGELIETWQGIGVNR